MTEPTEACGFLDGRFETLRRQLMLFEMEETDVPWIRFMSLDMTDDRLKRCREALLLIGAMGTYADTSVHSVWRSKMQDILWTGISLERLGGQPLMPAFDMSRAFAVDHTQEWEATMELLLGYDDLSESFDQDWSRLSEAARAQGLHVDHPHEIPILLTFTLSNEAYEDVQIKSLQVMRECLRKFQQSATAVARLHPCRPRFQLQGVQLDARHLLVTPRTMPRLLEVLALDIPIEALYMPTGLTRPKGSSWRNAWASLLFTVFGDPRAKVKTRRPIKTVDAYFTSQYMYRALCSVLAHTTNVHKFVCSGSSHPEHFTWKWLYYALFSKPTSVRSVVLNEFDDSNVNPSDMDPLYANYPHSQLLEGSTIDDDIDLGTVLLSKGTVIRFAPFQSNDKIVVKGPNSEVFQIIRKNPASTTIDILVPGYGNGIVDRGSALEKRQRPTSSLESVPATTSSAVKNLVVLDRHHSDGVADQVSQLIARVGQSLESLKIAAFDIDEEVIQHILKTCPNLSHLSPGRITKPAFDVLLNAFERDCAIRSIILFEHHEIDNMAEQVLERVADRTTRLAKRLTRLQVVSSPLPRKAAHHVADIVRTNNRLQYLYVFVSSQSFSTLDCPTVATGRDGVAHVIERVVGVALPMRAKCALLSVFAPSRLSTHLDRLVLTQIFEFAAEPAQSQIVTAKCSGTDEDENELEH